MEILGYNQKLLGHEGLRTHWKFGLFLIIADTSGGGCRTQGFNFFGLPPHHLKQGTVHLTPSLLVTDPPIHLVFA